MAKLDVNKPVENYEEKFVRIKYIKCVRENGYYSINDISKLLINRNMKISFSPPDMSELEVQEVCNPS